MMFSGMFLPETIKFWFDKSKKNYEEKDLYIQQANCNSSLSKFSAFQFLV